MSAICLPTSNPNRWYVPIVETNLIVLQPLTSNGRLSSRANAVILQNQGNVDILLDSGFTLEPGQCLEWGNTSELNTVKVDMNVRFLPDTVPPGEEVIQILQVIELKANMTTTGYYIDQPTLEPQTEAQQNGEN